MKATQAVPAVPFNLSLFERGTNDAFRHVVQIDRLALSPGTFALDLSPDNVSPLLAYERVNPITPKMLSRSSWFRTESAQVLRHVLSRILPRQTAKRGLGMQLGMRQ